MERRYLTMLIAFGFFMIIVGQVRIAVRNYEAMQNPGDPLIEAINEHVTKSTEPSGISRFTGGFVSRRAKEPETNIQIAPSQRAPDGYVPYAQQKKKPEVRKKPEPVLTELPPLDSATSTDKSSGGQSYYPTQSAKP